MNMLSIGTRKSIAQLPQRILSMRKALKLSLLLDSRSEIIPEAVAFQTELEEIIAQPTSTKLRVANYVLVCVLIGLFIAGGITKVDVVIGTPGRLAADAPPIVLQPIDRGIIRELKVKEGDIVSKGQVLATLDPTFAQADVAGLSARRRSLMAQLQRLDAELNGKAFDPGKSADPDLALQEVLYRQRTAQYASRLANFDAEISRDQAAIRTTEDDRASLTKQIGGRQGSRRDARHPLPGAERLEAQLSRCASQPHAHRTRVAARP